MAKYKKKPVIIEAEVYQVGMEDGWEFYPIMSNEFICYMTNEEMKTKPYPKTNRMPVIETLEGRMKINEGDYIITGVRGERYPCKPDIFEATYEKVEE